MYVQSKPIVPNNQINREEKVFRRNKNKERIPAVIPITLRWLKYTQLKSYKLFRQEK